MTASAPAVALHEQLTLHRCARVQARALSTAARCVSRLRRTTSSSAARWGSTNRPGAGARWVWEGW
eukprot:209387-Chlamydomonas_euryale.AAC.4